MAEPDVPLAKWLKAREQAQEIIKNVFSSDAPDPFERLANGIAVALIDRSEAAQKPDACEHVRMGDYVVLCRGCADLVGWAPRPPEEPK